MVIKSNNFGFVQNTIVSNKLKMSLRTEKHQKTSVDFSRYFDFLTKDYGLRPMENLSIETANMYVRVLRNQFVQVELAGDQDFFYAEIRRLVEGEPRPYYDEENNIDFKDLVVLKTNNNYDQSDFYPPSVGWIKVLKNTAKLFKNSKQVFKTDKWVDIRRIEELKETELFNKFGFKSNETKNKPTFFGLVKQHALELVGKGFKLVLDNSALPPYDSNSWTLKIVLESSSTRLKISQRDWRDITFCYYIEINGQEMYEIDLRNQPDIETAATTFNQQIDKLIS
jgi:hypothetical protein